MRLRLSHWLFSSDKQLLHQFIPPIQSPVSGPDPNLESDTIAEQLSGGARALADPAGRRLAIGEMSMKRMDEPRFGVAAANGSPPFSRIPEDRGSTLKRNRSHCPQYLPVIFAPWLNDARRDYRTGLSLGTMRDAPGKSTGRISNNRCLQTSLDLLITRWLISPVSKK